MATSDIPPDTLTLPNKELRLSLRSSATADAERERDAQSPRKWRLSKTFSISGFVLMGGDNIYEGPATPEDYRLKFEEPYKPLLDAGVKFYAVLGNHDDPAPDPLPAVPHGRSPLLHLHAARGRPVEARHPRPFLRARQHPPRPASSCSGCSCELEQSNAEWKIALMHYPLYSFWTLHAPGPAPALCARAFRSWRGGIDVGVFSGHEHFYQRSRLPGRRSCTSSAAARARCALVKPGPRRTSRKATISDYHFMLIEVSDEQLFLSGHQPEGRDNRRRLPTPAETAD